MEISLPLDLPSPPQVRCDHTKKQSRDTKWYFYCRFTYAFAWTDPVSNSVYQIGTGYSSNNAGDGPEKTRDRKNWFPRFKSNWLGSFRSKQMFQCCECAVMSAPSNSSFLKQTGRYKGAEGKHCRCGKDQWHLAKSVEETEYNRRMEISKALGGMRYDEAVLRLRSMDQSELDLTPFKHMIETAGSPTQPRSTRHFALSSSSLSSSLPSSLPKRTRSKSNSPHTMSVSRTYAASQLLKSEPLTLPTVPNHVYHGYENPAKHYEAYDPVYTNNSIEYAQAPQPQHPAEYNPVPFGDEENLGELLQGILEDDPRGPASGASMGLGPSQVNWGRDGYYNGALSNINVAPLKRTMSMPSNGMTPSTMASSFREDVEQEYYADVTRRSSLNLGVHQVPSYTNYRPASDNHQPVLQHFSYQVQQQHLLQQQPYSRPLSMTPSIGTATSTSFST